MSDESSVSDYFVERGKAEVKLLRKHFHILGHGDAVRIGGDLKPEDVRSFFREYFAEVRPPNLRDEKIFPKPNPSVLRSLYMGHPDANIFLNVVVRHILYVDQILIIDPFLTVPTDDGPKSPMKRPEMWVRALADRALCLCAVEAWIEAGLILLIPNVFHYHPEKLRIPLSFSLGSEQRKKYEERILIGMLVIEAPDVRDSFLDVVQQMGKQLSPSDRAELLEKTRKYEKENPIRFRLPQGYFNKYFGKSETVSVIELNSTGLPMWHASEIAGIVGAFLIFEDQFYYDILCRNMGPGEKRSEALQELSLAFQKLEFPFLNNVPSEIALELRKKGYLLGFRRYLRDAWAAASSDPGAGNLGDKMSDFRERLEVEYSQLEREWGEIRRDLRVSAAVTGAAAGLLISGSIVFGLASLVAGNVITPASESLKGMRQVYEKPLGVFLRLAH